MKKRTSIFSGLAALLAAVLVACGGVTTSTTVSESSAETEVEQQTTDGPRTGDTAPDFTLPDSSGNMVQLTDELQGNQQVVLVFYFAHT